MKRIIAACLLLSFFVLATPREWWHDCHEHTHVSSKGLVLKSKDCSACDYSIGYACEPVFYSGISEFSIPAPVTEKTKSVWLCDRFSISLLRAPPSI